VINTSVIDLFVSERVKIAEVSKARKTSVAQTVQRENWKVQKNDEHVDGSRERSRLVNLCSSNTRKH